MLTILWLCFPVNTVTITITVKSVHLQLKYGTVYQRQCSLPSHWTFFDAAWKLNCSSVLTTDCQTTLLLRDSLSLSRSFLLWLQPWSLSTIMLLWHSFLIIIINCDRATKGNISTTNRKWLEMFLKTYVVCHLYVITQTSLLLTVTVWNMKTCASDKRFTLTQSDTNWFLKSMHVNSEVHVAS